MDSGRSRRRRLLHQHHRRALLQELAQLRGAYRLEKTTARPKPAHLRRGSYRYENNVTTVEHRGQRQPTLVNATVTVLDVDDPGKVTLDHLQPAEGVDVYGQVADEDDGEKTKVKLNLPALGNTLNPADAICPSGSGRSPRAARPAGPPSPARRGRATRRQPPTWAST